MSEDSLLRATRPFDHPTLAAMKALSDTQSRLAGSCTQRLSEQLQAILAVPVLPEQVRLASEASARLAEQLSRLSIPSGILGTGATSILAVNERLRQAVVPLMPSLPSVAASMRMEVPTFSAALNFHLSAAARFDLARACIPQAAFAWDSSIRQLTARLAETGVLAGRADLSARLLLPHRSYTRFVGNTARRIDQAEDPVDAEALEASIFVAEEHLVATTDALARVIAPVMDEQPLPPPYRPSVFRVQQQELLALTRPIERGDDRALIPPPAAEYGSVAAQVMCLIADCNEAARVVNGIEVFKPTTRLVHSCGVLASVVPMGRETFAQFVDALYFALYEAAGEDKLRFLKENGGVFEREECDFIFWVKFLRSKWLRHDPDHGDETKIKKSWRDVSQVFDHLGLGRYPHRGEDFRLLHRSLLDEAFGFLSELLTRLAGSPGKDH